jgi:internalin A
MSQGCKVFQGWNHFSSHRVEKVRANMTLKKIVVVAVLMSLLGCRKEEDKRVSEMPRMAPRPMTIQAGIPQPGRYDSRRFSRNEDLNLRDQLEALPGIEVKTNDDGKIIYVDFRQAGGGGHDQITWLYGLPFVETLILTGQQVDNAMISVVAGHPNLKVLNVAQKSSVDNDALPLLLSLKKLEDLSLEGSNFTDDNLEELAKISTLRKLRLRGTGVTAAGIKKLAAMIDLEVLDLRDCSEIGNAGLEAISGFTKLKSLLVNGENVTDEGVAFLKPLTELQLLVLPRSQVTDAGIAALSEQKKLKELDLFQAPISDVGLATFAEAKDLVKLKIRGTKVTSEGMRVIEKYEKLAELDLSETAVDDAAIEILSQRSSLVDINFLRTQISSKGVEKLATMKLKRLNLDDVKGVDDACLPAVATMESLEFLHLGKTAVTDAGVSALAQMKGLKTLILENTTVSPGKIEELKAALPSTEIKYSVEGAAAG